VPQGNTNTYFASRPGFSFPHRTGLEKRAIVVRFLFDRPSPLCGSQT